MKTVLPKKITAKLARTDISGYICDIGRKSPLYLNDTTMKPRLKYLQRIRGGSKKTARKDIPVVTVTLPNGADMPQGVLAGILREKPLRFSVNDIEIKDGFGTRLRLVKVPRRTVKPFPSDIVRLAAPVPVKIHGISRAVRSARGMEGVAGYDGIDGYISSGTDNGGSEIYVVPDAGHTVSESGTVPARKRKLAIRKRKPPVKKRTAPVVSAPSGEGEPPTLPEPDIEMLREAFDGTPEPALRQLLLQFIRHALKTSKPEAEHIHSMLSTINNSLGNPFNDLLDALYEEINRMAKEITITVNGDYVAQKILNENRDSNVFNASVTQSHFLTRKDDEDEESQS